jgi:hypothetical protein
MGKELCREMDSKDCVGAAADAPSHVTGQDGHPLPLNVKKQK